MRFLGMHFPKTNEEIKRAKERLAYEELFQLLLASQLNRQEKCKIDRMAYSIRAKDSSSVC